MREMIHCLHYILRLCHQPATIGFVIGHSNNMIVRDTMMNNSAIFKKLTCTHFRISKFNAHIIYDLR